MTQSHKTVSCFDWYKMSSEKRTEDRDLDWEMMGTRVKMSPSFGCVMVLGGCGGADIPGEIKVCGEFSLTWNGTYSSYRVYGDRLN